MVLSNNLEGWDRGGMGRTSQREGIYVHVELIHAVIQQRLTQHCKALILQLKINKDKSRNRKRDISKIRRDNSQKNQHKKVHV